MEILINYKIGDIEVQVVADSKEDLKEALEAARGEGFGPEGDSKGKAAPKEFPPEEMETEPVKPADKPKKKKAAPKKEEPKEEQPKEEQPKEEQRVEPDPADQKAELQHLATTAIKDGKKAEVKAALESVGAKRLSEVREDDYKDVSDQLRALV